MRKSSIRISSFKQEKQKEIKSKTFWIAVAFASLTAVGSTMGQSNRYELYT